MIEDKEEVRKKIHKLLAMLEDKGSQYRVGWFSCPTQADEIKKEFQHYLDIECQEYDDVDGRYLLTIDKKKLLKH
tara:strand:+ start:8516 stop:8740 length:225 start_codon:yes stop_codon:yes gene_type:complete